MRPTICTVIGLLMMLSGCSTAPQPRTPGMDAIGVSETTIELRQKIYHYERTFAAIVHQAADEIFLAESDRTIKEATVRWKINSAPAMQSAVFQLDPLGGMADAWGLTRQMERFFTVGNGKDIFGDSQPIAVDASRELLTEVRALVRSVVGEERMSRFEPKLEAWVVDNPIENISFGRRRMDVDATAITAAEWGGGGLQSVGNIEELVRDLSDRITIYATQMPEIARSHAELVMIEADHYLIPPLWESFEGIDRSAKGIDSEVRNVRTFLDDAPELVATERAAIVAALEKEMQTALGDVDRQRVDTLDAVSAEREAIFSGIDALRVQLLADVHAARQDAGADVEAIFERQARALIDEADTLIDKIFWRGLILLVIGLVGLAVVLRMSRPPSHA